MPSEPAVIIVGSGPAGVSAAFPLVRAGIRVLMLDAGLTETPGAPEIPGSLRELRRNPDHWKTLIGERYERFSTQAPELSPKLRTPAYSHVFRDYRKRYPANTENFVLVGSLARGGLSTAWGAAVSMLSDRDLEDYPIAARDLQPSYQRISRRIGVSGCSEDDLSETHGHVDSLLPPLDLGSRMSVLYRRYRARRSPALTRGVRFGRSRTAALTEARADRHGCVYCGRCFWGCPQKSIWSAAYDLASLTAHPAFTYRGGYFVKRLIRRETGYELVADSMHDNRSETFSAGRVILACGAIGSAKLALEALEWSGCISFQSSPYAELGFLLPRWRWAALDDHVTALGQLTFRLDDARLESGYVMGNLYETGGLLAGDLIQRMPFSYSRSRKLVRLMQPAMLIGILWLSGRYSRYELRIRAGGGPLELKGGYSPATSRDITRARKRLGAVMRRYGVLPIPGAFRIYPPGGDFHYGGTVPMRTSPKAHQADARGEVQGLPGVHVVDGAALTSIPAKPHTFTIMANADRIAHILAATLPRAAGAASSQTNPD